MFASIAVARHLVNRQNISSCGTETELESIKSNEWVYRTIVPSFYYGLLNNLILQEQHMTLNTIIFGGFLFIVVITLGCVSLAATAYRPEGATTWKYFKTDLKVEGSIVATMIGLMVIYKVFRVVMHYREIRTYATLNNLNEEELEKIVIGNEIDEMLQKAKEERTREEKESQKGEESDEDNLVNKHAQKKEVSGNVGRGQKLLNSKLRMVK